MFSIKSSRWFGFFSNSWINLIFPARLEIKNNEVHTRKYKSLIFFWMKDEEALALLRVSSTQHKKGLIWDKVLIESKGGTNYIEMKGLKKKDAKDLITFISPNINKLAV